MDDKTIDTILIFFQIVFWIICIYKIWPRNRLYGLFGMILYLYLLPTEICYRFYPRFHKYYWGVDNWYVAYWYINFSLLALLIVLNKTSREHRVYDVIHYKKYSFGGLAWILIFSYSTIATYLFYSNIDNVSYQALVQNGATGNEDVTLATIDLLLKNIPAFVIFPLLSKPNVKWYLKLFIIYNVLLFVVYNILSGSRSDILALTVGVVLIWIYGHKIKLKQILILVGLAVVFILVAVLTYAMRGGSNDGTLAEILLMQDYTYPAYNIIAVIAKDIVDPSMVLISQLGKAFPVFGADWLYMPIGQKVFPEVEMSPSQSMGFHPFAEGYLFAGFVGFIYNGLVIGFGLALWNRFMSTNNKRFNKFMFAMMGSLFFAMVRAQSVWFVRYLYLTFIPAVFLYSRLFNIKINYLGFFKNHSKSM